MSIGKFSTTFSRVSSTLTLKNGSVPLYHIAMSISDPVLTDPLADEPKICANGISGKLVLIAEAIFDMLIKLFNIY
jgi:hypothetical protein